MEKFKIGDRVKRLPAKGITATPLDNAGDAELNAGSHGIIKFIREETASTAAAPSAEARSRALMIQVQWDNGTLSYLGPDRLQVI